MGKNQMIRRFFSEAIEVAIPKPVFNHEQVNPEEYRDLDQKIKFKTGYALVEVEPFPRMKIMELCLHILAKLKAEIPAHAYYRIFTEEKIKYLMEITHETPNIKLLEKKLATDSIELFIEALSHEMIAVDQMKEAKPWIDNDTPEEIGAYEMVKVPYDQYMRYETFTHTPKPTLLKK